MTTPLPAFNSWTDPEWLEAQAMYREKTARSLDTSLLLVIRSSRRLSLAARTERVRRISQTQDFRESKQKRDAEVEIAIRYRLLLLRIQFDTSAFDQAVTNLHSIRDAYEALSQVTIQIDRAGVREAPSREPIENVPDRVIAALHSLAVGTDLFRSFKGRGLHPERALSDAMSQARWATRDVALAAGQLTNVGYLVDLRDAFSAAVGRLDPGVQRDWRARSAKYLVDDFRKTVTPGTVAVGVAASIASTALINWWQRDTEVGDLPRPEQTAKPEAPRGTVASPVGSGTKPQSQVGTEDAARRVESFDSGISSDVDHEVVASSDWPLDHANLARTGHMPGFGPVGQPEVLWRYRSRGEYVRLPRTKPGHIMGNPIIANGSAYVKSDERNLYAIDLESGQQRWKYRTREPGTNPHVDNSMGIGPSFIAVSEEMVFTAALTTLRALDARSGHEQWMFKQKEIPGNPCIVGDLLLVPRAHSLLALDKTTGNPVWTYDSPISHIAIDQDIIYACGVESLHAIELSTRRKIWDVNVPSPRSSLAVANGLIHLACGNELLTVDAVTSRVRWQKKHFSNDWGSYVSLAVAHGAIFASGVHGMTAFDATTGEELWHSPSSFRLFSPLAVVGGAVYASSMSQLCTFNAETGSMVWKFDIDELFESGPAVSRGVVYVCGGGFLWAIGGSQNLALERRVE